MSSLISYFYRFGDFAVDMDQRVLLRRDKPVPLTPKVFETLLILVEQHGRIVGKDELMNRLWPDSFVEEANLTFNIQQLRKALGDHARQPIYIETVARRGYRFIAEVEEVLTETGVPQGRISVRPDNLETSAGNGFAAGSESLPSADVLSEMAARPPAQPAPLPPVARHSTARRYFVWSSVGVVLIGGLAAVVFWWSSAGNVAPTRQMKFERLTANGKTKLAAVSPDGKFVAYIISDEGQESLWLKNVAAGSEVQILPPAKDTRLHGITFSPDGNYIFYGAKGMLFQLPVLGDTPKKVLPQFGGSVSILPDGKQITFIRYLSEGEETAHVVVANADGTNERILASSKRPNIFLRSPVWSPDGKVIACAALTSSGTQEVVTVRVADGVVSSVPSPPWATVWEIVWRPDGKSLLVAAGDYKSILNQIWSLSYPGGEARRITDDAHNYRSISLSANGRSLVAVRAEAEAHLWAMPGGDTSQAKQLTSGFEKYDGVFAINWTTDDKIIYETAPSGRPAVWRIDADGRNLKELSAEAGGGGASPDGKYLVYQSEGGLFRLSFNDGEKKRLTTGADLDAAFSPDGQWVVFTRYADDVALWKVPLEGGEAVKLTNFLGYPHAPAISPDGKFIAFYRDRSGMMSFPALAVAPIDGGEIVKEFDVQIERPQNFGKTAVQWTSDGRAIDYVSLRDGVSNIWRQPLDGSPPFQVTNFTDRRIFNFASSPDGKQLALSRGAFNRDVVLITNPY